MKFGTTLVKKEKSKTSAFFSSINFMYHAFKWLMKESIFQIYSKMIFKETQKKWQSAYKL